MVEWGGVGGGGGGGTGGCAGQSGRVRELISPGDGTLISTVTWVGGARQKWQLVFGRLDLTEKLSLISAASQSWVGGALSINSNTKGQSWVGKH